MAQTNLETGRELIAGWVSTRQVPLGIDTYYIGMRLEYQADGTGVTTGTGDGTATAIVAESGVAAGDWVLTFTAALIADLADPDGNVVAYGITVPNGGAVTVKIAGITMTLTDGATAWVATDYITITIEAAGEYVALADGKIAAIYNGTDARVLAAPGVDDCIVAGEISATGIKDTAGADVTLTKDLIAAYRDAGFYVKEN